MLINTLGWTLSFPNFCGVRYLFEKCTLRFGPNDFVLFCYIDLDFGRSISWNTQPDGFEFFNKAMDPCPPLFLGFWLGWLWNSVCLNTHFLQNLHPESDLWFLTYGRMPTITRRIRTVPFKVISARFLIFPSWTATAPEGFSFRRTFSVILCLRSWSRRGQSCLISTLDVVVAETASISCWPLSFCFPLIANSFSSFNATWSSPVFLSTLTFPFWSNQYSCFNSLISGLKIPCFDHLTFLSASRDVDQFLVRTLPMLFWVDQTLVFASYELSRILSLGTSLVDNKTWSHPVPKSWISSQWKVIPNRSEESRTATGLPYTGRFLEECNTSTIKSQRSRAGMPSMRRPASKERTSDSVELWETEVRVSHIQLVWTMFDFRRHTKVSPRLI